MKTNSWIRIQISRSPFRFLNAYPFQKLHEKIIHNFLINPTDWQWYNITSLSEVLKRGHGPVAPVKDASAYDLHLWLFSPKTESFLGYPKIIFYTNFEYFGIIRFWVKKNNEPGFSNDSLDWTVVIPAVKDWWRHWRLPELQSTVNQDGRTSVRKQK